MSKYQIGDKAVYPGHGVGEIEAIEKKEINGETLSFYIMRIIDSGLKIMVPTTNLKITGMRDLITENEINKVFSILKEQDIKIENITWNKRFKDYNERLKSGSIYEVASVLRDLIVLSKTKDLSFGEKRMFEMAVNLISQEISFVTGSEQEDIVEQINKIIKEG
jgi:CarD family transcriptional regulator